MPSYKAHLVGGCVAFSFLYAVFVTSEVSPVLSLEWLICVLIGSLFPDIDTESRGRKMYQAFLSLLGIFFFLKYDFFGLSLVMMFMLLPTLLTHRGLTHSIIFMAIVCMGIVYCMQWRLPHYYILIAYDALFFFTGACSHILLDRIVSYLKKHVKQSYT